MAIYTLPEFASYMQQDVDTATATLLQTLTDGVIGSRITVTVPASAEVKAVALEVAARAYRNPNRLNMETIDDYTWRVDNAGEAGVFLTEADISLLDPATASSGAFTIRAPARPYVVSGGGWWGA